jgi:hypothetical protein
MIAPSFEARIAAGTSQYQVKVDSGAFVSLDADNYFPSSAWPGSITDYSLLQELVAKLSAVVASTQVTLQPTGQIKIQWGTGTHGIAFNAALQALLGFASSSYGAATGFTSEGSCTAVWLPSRPFMPTDLYDGLGRFSDDAQSRRAQSGLVWRSVYNRYRDKRWDFAALLARRTWTAAEVLAGESFQSFWANWLSGADGVFRYYKSATDPTSYTVEGTPRDYVLTKFDQPTRYATRPAPIDTLWNLSFEAALYVH